jgi:hypothetical protein
MFAESGVLTLMQHAGRLFHLVYHFERAAQVTLARPVFIPGVRDAAAGA